MSDNEPVACGDTLSVLRTLIDGVRGMGLGDPDCGDRIEASDVVRWAVDEIERLRITDAEREAVECGIQAIGLAPRDERTLAYADRHAFQILEELGAECDRLGVRVVDVHGESGLASEFFATIVSYIEAREKECDRATLTDAEREAIQRAIDSQQHRAAEMHSRSWNAAAIDDDCDTLRGLLERLG